MKLDLISMKLSLQFGPVNTWYNALQKIKKYDFSFIYIFILF
jgi:hypothetical protein